MKQFFFKILVIALITFTHTTCVTQIIIFDGTSSVGKSTLITEVAKRLNNSAIVRCDEVAIPVFNRLVKEGGHIIVDNAPGDLMSLYRIAPELDNGYLDDQVNEEMYQQIRMHASLGKIVLNDNAWVKQKDVDDCKLQLDNYKVIRIFVHGSFDDILTRVLKRNNADNEIDHRPITLPFQVFPIMYRVHDSTNDQPCIDTWTKTMVDDIMEKLANEFEQNKHSYNKYWVEDGNNFFSSVDDFYKHFKLDTQSVINVIPTFPFDFVVNTSTMSTEECVQQIISWIQQ